MAQPAQPPPPASFLEQFIKFGTDAYGLERILRFFQSIAALLLFSAPFRTVSSLLLLPLVNPWALSSFSSAPLKPPASPLLDPAAAAVLHPLRSRLTSLRQALRLFRFLESFSAAWEVWNALGRDSDRRSRRETAQLWADLGAKMFMGIYLLLESAVFVEVVLGVPFEVGVWGSRERVGELVMDGQRFWFGGLVCGVVVGILKLCQGGAEKEEKEEKKKKGEKDAATVKRDGGRKTIVRRLAADAMDLALPGSAVGWLPLGPETVAWLMLGSTILTGMEIWERCGREVAAAKRRAAGAAN
ncbi:hypothetical protein VTJ83DRAFT_5521 [Remersonia thermophila]|uniref:Uncharacterized protein n=1 Tax=Remersonia thermophila TaxID=72144 RepID=A0ABR4D728_9PEZI